MAEQQTAFYHQDQFVAGAAVLDAGEAAARGDRSTFVTPTLKIAAKPIRTRLMTKDTNAAS
ncbi:hypothetical protein A9D14_09895 [Croceicoccus marinus]|uniref:Uncharacterized protein n=1 Tax=Croceicoccus marinus TaxID=450378 RepID=A0A1Z1FCJ0_9SPHN|nr:hypothetical protein A9D14_09895 [Croceicoccus marinus]